MYLAFCVCRHDETYPQPRWSTRVQWQMRCRRGRRRRSRWRWPWRAGSSSSRSPGRPSSKLSQFPSPQLVVSLTVQDNISYHQRPPQICLNSQIHNSLFHSQSRNTIVKGLLKTVPIPKSKTCRFTQSGNTIVKVFLKTAPFPGSSIFGFTHKSQARKTTINALFKTVPQNPQSLVSLKIHPKKIMSKLVLNSIHNRTHMFSTFRVDNITKSRWR